MSVNVATTLLADLLSEKKVGEIFGKHRPISSITVAPAPLEINEPVENSARGKGGTKLKRRRDKERKKEKRRNVSLMNRRVRSQSQKHARLAESFRTGHDHATSSHSRPGYIGCDRDCIGTPPLSELLKQGFTLREYTG
jgi:hypothetical protein